MTEKIRVENLYKVFGNEPQKALDMLKNGAGRNKIIAETGQAVAVNDVSFTVQEGEIFVIMGLSGSGKSTILRCLNRLIEPSSGCISIDSQDITKLNSKELRLIRQKKIAMVFQQFGLLPQRTVLQNAAYGLEIRGFEQSEREETAKRILDLVGLSGWEHSYPDNLSGGMKQRVGLARALANDPDILLMDEAFSALDPLIRQEMQDELLRLQQQFNKTVIFVTHDIKEAVKIADRVAFVKDGSLVQVGKMREVIKEPVNDYVAKFVKSLDA